MDRPTIGTMPAATERDDESYLDFTEGMRIFNNGAFYARVKARADAAIADWERVHGRKVTTTDDARQALDPVPIVAARNRLFRSSHLMMWDAVFETYRKREAELLAELDRADRSGPGTVQYDPNFPLPAYFTDVDFHAQQGSYDDDPLAGYVYHYGSKVVFQGTNDRDEVHEALVDLIPVPADGQVRTILDLACSVGQSTTALKRRFPRATVTGIDAGAPMLRYAHKRAIEMGREVHFVQRLAEATGYPNGGFDLVYTFLLFHELPVTIAQQVLTEARRILRPGGLFVTVDGPTGRPVTPFSLYTTHFSATSNGEPYSGAYAASDFDGMMQRAGFVRIEERPLQGLILPYTMKIGEA